MNKLAIFVKAYFDAVMQEVALMAKDYPNLVDYAIVFVMWFNPITGLLWLVISALSGGSDWFQVTMSFINFLCCFAVMLAGAKNDSKHTFRPFFVSAKIALITTFIHLYKVIICHHYRFYLLVFIFTFFSLVLYFRKRIQRKIKRICARAERKIRDAKEKSNKS